MERKKELESNGSSHMNSGKKAVHVCKLFFSDFFWSILAGSREERWRWKLTGNGSGRSQQGQDLLEEGKVS